jgi:hypothetical protein
MRYLVVFGIALLALACAGGGSNVRSSGARDQTPSWLAEGSGAVRGDGGKRLQGVGVATGVPDPRARRRQADAAAREQLQMTVDALARGLAKMSESSQQGLVETTTSLARKAAAQSAAIRDHWVTPDGDERALAVLDLDALRRALQASDSDDRVRGEMAANVDRAFDQLAAGGSR